MGDPADAARLYTAHLAHSDFETLEPGDGWRLLETVEGCQEGFHNVAMITHKSCLSTYVTQPMREVSTAFRVHWGGCR